MHVILLPTRGFSPSRASCWVVISASERVAEVGYETVAGLRFVGAWAGPSQFARGVAARKDEVQADGVRVVVPRRSPGVAGAS